MLAVNSAYCSSVGDTPFFLYRHRDPDAPLHLRTSPRTSSKAPQQCIRDDIHRSKIAYDIIKGKLLESADRNLRYKDKYSHDNKISVDDRVYIKYVKNKPGDNKLSPRFSGPFRVISQKSPSIFKLKNLLNKKEVECHVENMKLVKERFASLQDFPRARLPFQEPETDCQSPMHQSEQPAAAPADPNVPADTEQNDPPITRRVTRSQTRPVVGNVSQSDISWNQSSSPLYIMQKCYEYPSLAQFTPQYICTR